MSQEPKWLTDLDLAAFRSGNGPQIAAMWATWAIVQLPPAVREVAAKAWSEGKTPADVMTQLNTP